MYELAHELGLTNKEALDLCLSLGMGVKSHSSSIEDAQADRARRKADREGLRRDVQPEEPEAPAKPAKKAAAKKAAPAADTAPAADAEADEPKTPVKRSGARLVTSRPDSEQPGASPAPRAPASPTPRPAAAAAPAAPGRHPRSATAVPGICCQTRSTSSSRSWWSFVGTVAS